MRRAVRRGRWLERWVGHAAGGCVLLAGHPRVRGVVRWRGTPCLPSGTVVSLQHRQSRTDGHSVQEPGAAPSPPNTALGGCSPVPPKHSPQEQGCPWPQGLGTVPWCPPGEGSGTPTRALPLLPSRGAPSPPHAGCQAPGAQCTEGTGRCSARHRRHKATLLPPTAAAPARCGGTRGQRPHAGTGTHTLPRRSSRRMRGRFRRCSRHGRRQDGRGPRGLTSPLRPYVPQHRAMLWPGLSTAMNSWPRNVHEAAAAAATSKQPPPRVAPGRSLPRHGVDGGHGACSGHPKRSSAGNRPPRPGRPQGSPAAGEPRCTSRHGGQRRGASHPAKPQHVPSAQGGCARTACGDQQRSSPLSQLTSPLQMHLWGTCPGPQPRPPHSGQRRRSCPGMMPDLPWCRGHPAPARDPSSGSTAWWGHQRPAPAGLGERLLPQGDVTYRARLCLQSSSQSSTRGKVWALQTWAGAAPPPCAGAR